MAGAVSDIPRDARGWPSAIPDAAVAVCQDIYNVQWFSTFFKKDISILSQKSEIFLLVMITLAIVIGKHPRVPQDTSGHTRTDQDSS